VYDDNPYSTRRKTVVDAAGGDADNATSGNADGATGTDTDYTSRTNADNTTGANADNTTGANADAAATADAVVTERTADRCRSRYRGPGTPIHRAAAPAGCRRADHPAR
jgi:hypothetical protein